MEKKNDIKYIVSGEEMNVIKKALDYAYHRLKYHPEAGIHQVLTLQQVEKLRKEIK